MFYCWYFDVLCTKDFLFSIIHWTLFTAYSSQSDSSVFAIYRPVSSFDAKYEVKRQKKYSRKSVVRHNNDRQMPIVSIKAYTVVLRLNLQ